LNAWQSSVLFSAIHCTNLLQNTIVNTFELTESYLDNFALPVNTREELHRLKPTSILFVFNDLIEDLENGLIEETTYFYDEL